MKTKLLIILFVFMSSFAFSQSKEEIKIKAKIEKYIEKINTLEAECELVCFNHQGLTVIQDQFYSLKAEKFCYKNKKVKTTLTYFIGNETITSVFYYKEDVMVKMTCSKIVGGIPEGTLVIYYIKGEYVIKLDGEYLRTATLRKFIIDNMNKDIDVIKKFLGN